MRLKKQEEEKRDRALKLLEMPPPKINFSHMRTIYGPRPGIGFPDGWKRNYENSIGAHSREIFFGEGFQNFFLSHIFSRFNWIKFINSIFLSYLTSP